MKRTTSGISFLLIVLQMACVVIHLPSSPPADIYREDGAQQVKISVEEGSWQNPAWSPDGKALMVTKFQGGYNTGPADLYVVNIPSGGTRTLVLDGGDNVNLPGSAWNPLTGQIVFSSSREPHDEIYLIDEDGIPGEERRVTNRVDRMAYEPSLSPDGEWVVFESHEVDVEDNGVIVKYRIDGSMPYQDLTSPNEDCRQPNWSPARDEILYQKFSDGQWNIWVMDSDGIGHHQVTRGTGDKTDSSFSPDGHWIVYSAEQPGLAFANIFITSIADGDTVQVTHFDGYDGAPSWSPDGKQIAFESCPGDPDDSSGTTVWIIDVPTGLQ